jgi:hypothetical protein
MSCELREIMRKDHKAANYIMTQYTIITTEKDTTAMKTSVDDSRTCFDLVNLLNLSNGYKLEFKCGHIIDKKDRQDYSTYNIIRPDGTSCDITETLSPVVPMCLECDVRENGEVIDENLREKNNKRCDEVMKNCQNRNDLSEKDIEAIFEYVNNKRVYKEFEDPFSIKSVCYTTMKNRSR